MGRYRGWPADAPELPPAEARSTTRSARSPGDAIRGLFDCVLVDEYQDTNTLQAQIVDIVGAHHRVMAVGDDAQCIYSWRGADFENILTFPDRHPGTQIYRIETNYRSTPSILAFANGVLAAQPKAKECEVDQPEYRKRRQRGTFRQPCERHQQRQGGHEAEAVEGDVADER